MAHLYENIRLLYYLCYFEFDYANRGRVLACGLGKKFVLKFFLSFI